MAAGIVVPDVQQAAEPSPVEFNPSEQSTWTPEQRDEWNKSGNIPKAPKKAESAPAKKESDNAADSDTAKHSQEKPKQKTKLSAEDRIAELESTIKKIKDGAGIKETKAEPSPARQAAPKLEEPKKPKLEEFDDFNKFEEAKDKYYLDMADYRAKKAVAEDREQRQMEEQRTKVESEFAEAKKIYPDFEEKAAPIIKALTEDQSIHEAFKIAVGTSDVFTHLAYALSQEQSQALLELARTNPIQAVKKLGVLEESVRAELGKKAKPEVEDKTPEPIKPRAPKPPSEVGGRGTAPEDEQRAAAKSGDFARFAEAENRKKFAAKA